MKTRYSLLLFALALIGIGATTYTITQLTENATPGAGTIIEIYDPTATPKSGKITLNSAGFRTAAGVTAAFIQANQTNVTLASLGGDPLFARTVLPAPTDAGVTLTFAATPVYSKLVTTGNVTLAFATLDVNRTYDLLIANSQATNITVTLPAEAADGFTKMGFIPTTIAAKKHGRYWFEVDCQTNTIVYGTFAEQP